ncbi:TetR/AcrR family transcriptional regulator [Planomonospora parontospora]|uniref:TetR/AcrR family transcriptional regulator n=1 Tax=Planomonospora parontospora TaxID=58119 RepID=UPI0016706E3B|nr:TetR/AcrR family transcriptional regulator [Planomonospora parontospora]GGL51216.1 TetR family transcriptional regulator [Planomonospora parontospora subsp. antibiotica]GII19078.1 TetR family transcriptional regulator [Planomonospora parontospora subsp. antibiotica]
MDVRPITEEDLTTRARIRDAAMALFAEQGVKATTIRGIAEAAKVSPGLVQHHFGTKEALRHACDEYVLGYLRDQVTAGVTDRGLDKPEFIENVHRTAPPLMKYLGRALVDGSPAAAAMFDELVRVTEEHLADDERSEADHRARATVLTAMKLGITVLHEHVSRALGTDLYDSRGALRAGKAQLDLIRPEFLGRELFDRARTGLEKLEGRR